MKYAIYLTNKRTKVIEAIQEQFHKIHPDKVIPTGAQVIESLLDVYSQLFLTTLQGHENNCDNNNARNLEEVHALGESSNKIT